MAERGKDKQEKKAVGLTGDSALLIFYSVGRHNKAWYFLTCMIAALQEEFLDELKSSGELLVSLSKSTAIHRSKGRFHGFKDNC